MLWEPKEYFKLTSAFSVLYFKDTQLNWFNFTSLFEGLAASIDPVMAAKNGSCPQPPNWKDVFATNTYWGPIHAQSYINLINECLDLNLPKDIMTLGSLRLDFEVQRPNTSSLPRYHPNMQTLLHSQRYLLPPTSCSYSWKTCTPFGVSQMMLLAMHRLLSFTISICHGTDASQK
jgi:hypothetical protein